MPMTLSLRKDSVMSVYQALELIVNSGIFLLALLTYLDKKDK
ncbi:putative holin-like toxin [Streptococcus ovis]|nr:putative holin-like toxin [Streptococcus ovis]